MTPSVLTLVLATLQAEQPVSVAASEAAGLLGTDLPVARRPTDGEPVVPATGVAGSLRAHAATSLDPTEVTALFGGPDNENALTPSLVRVLGTWTQPPSGHRDLEPVLRSQTAVDRRTGAGRTRSLRSREHLPVGTGVHVLMLLVDAGQDQVASLQRVLETWRPHLGGARGTGHGACSLSALHALTLDLGVPDDLATWLGLDGPTGADVVRQRGVPWSRNQQDGSSGVRRVELAVSFPGDVRVGTGTGSAADVGGPKAADLAVDDAGNPVIPGSSIRGVLRSRAELIMRSLGHECCTGSGADCAPRCLACRVFGHTGQRSPVRALDAPLRSPTLRAVPHVAIDRFSGGAMRGGLFTETVASETSTVLTIEIDEGPLADVAEALISQAALDMDDGFVGFGHATRRGLGAARLTDEARTRCRAATSNLAKLVDEANADGEVEASA